MGDHAIFSPSSAHRWLWCTASLTQEGKLPPQEPNIYMEEGNKAHFVAENFLLNKLITDVDISPEMEEAARTYANSVRSYAEGSPIFVERKVDFAKTLNLPKGEAFGTPDAVVVKKEELQIHDFKYGVGVKVEAKGNEQLLLYAIGASENFSYFADFKRIKLVVHQPRILRMSVWNIDTSHFKEIIENLKLKAAKVLEYKEKNEFNLKFFNPGKKQCSWCRCKATCPALANRTNEIVGVDFKEPIKQKTLPDPKDMAVIDIIRILDNSELVEIWLKAVKKKALDDLLSKEKIPGYKVVEGRKGIRKWNNENEVEIFLKNKMPKRDSHENKLKSPSQIEKVLSESPKKMGKLKELFIVRSDGKPTVVPVDDPRPALKLGTSVEDFRDLTKIENKPIGE